VLVVDPLEIYVTRKRETSPIDVLSSWWFHSAESSLLEKSTRTPERI
jgi:hypothetical protein